MDDMQTNEHGGVPIKFCLRNQEVGWVWPVDFSFLIPFLEKWKFVFTKIIPMQKYVATLFLIAKIGYNQIYFNGWVDKQTMVQPKQGILLGSKKEWILDIGNNLDDSQRHFQWHSTEWKSQSQEAAWYIMLFLILTKI